MMTAAIRIPILTYHGIHVMGNDYDNNDHVAFWSDLQLIQKLGKRVVSLQTIVDWRLGRLPDSAVENAVGLSCDDGAWFDFYDLDHPHHGPQPGFFSLLRRAQKELELTPHLTAFVIVSPEARTILDQTCMVGCGWWTDGWWREAASSGLMDIGNHSMDHFHVTLPCNPEGVASFKPIDSQDACDYQVREAQTRLRDITAGLASGLFAYPYGDFSDYIVDEYLPRFGDAIGLNAAFATQPEPVHADTPRWQMPRYVCGHDWKSPYDLEQILE